MNWTNPKLSRRALVAIVLAALLVSGGAIAASYLFTAGAGTTYETGSGLEVSTSVNHGVESSNPFSGSDSVTINDVTFSATGQANVTVDRFEGTWTNVSAVDASSNDITINPNDKPQATVGGSVTALSFRDTMSLSDDEAAFVYSAGGTGTVTINGLAANTDYTAATASGTELDSGTTDGSGSATISVSSATDAKVILFTDQAPVVDAASASPSGGEVVQTRNPTLSINVTDREFGATQGDTVTATAYDASDDSQIGSTTLNANGTASVTWSGAVGGSNSYYWIIEDNYGESVQTQEFGFKLPDELRIYQETSPNKLIQSGINVEVTFFAADTVITRSTSDGVLNLTNLPVTDQFVVRANPDSGGYLSRRIVITSITEQQEIYLLNSSKSGVTTADTTFQLQDSTGSFGASETRLFIKRPIRKDYDGDGNSTTRFQTVSADVFGATARYPTTLQDTARYRLVVRNEDGNSRTLGAFRPDGSRIYNVPVGQVSLSGGDSTFSFQTRIEEQDGNEVLKIIYRDEEGLTESLNWSVHVRGNESRVISTGVEPGPINTYVATVDINDSAERSYNTTFEIVRDGETVQGSDLSGGITAFAGDWPIEQRWLSLLGYIAIVAMGGLMVIVNGRLGALATAGFAILLTMAGIVAIPTPLLGAAAMTAVLFNVAGRG
jgi:hypothetical protein